MMAQGIINGLEIIQINKQQGANMAKTFCS